MFLSKSCPPRLVLCDVACHPLCVLIKYTVVGTTLGSTSAVGALGNQLRFQPRLCVCAPIKPAAAGAGPTLATGAPVIILDVPQVLRSQNCQNESAKVAHPLGVSSEFSPLAPQRLHAPRTHSSGARPL